MSPDASLTFKMADGGDGGPGGPDAAGAAGGCFPLQPQERAMVSLQPEAVPPTAPRGQPAPCPCRDPSARPSLSGRRGNRCTLLEGAASSVAGPQCGAVEGRNVLLWRPPLLTGSSGGGTCRGITAQRPRAVLRPLRCGQTPVRAPWEHGTAQARSRRLGLAIAPAAAASAPWSQPCPSPGESMSGGPEGSGLLPALCSIFCRGPGLCLHSTFL